MQLIRSGSMVLMNRITVVPPGFRVNGWAQILRVRALEKLVLSQVGEVQLGSLIFVYPGRLLTLFEEKYSSSSARDGLPEIENDGELV